MEFQFEDNFYPMSKFEDLKVCIEGSFIDRIINSMDFLEADDSLQVYEPITPQMTPEKIRSFVVKDEKSDLDFPSPMDMKNETVEEDASVQWNSLPRKLKEMLYEKYLDKIKLQKTTLPEDFMKLLYNMGFIEEFAKWYVQENIKESINFQTLKYHLGILIASAQEQVSSVPFEL